MEKNTILYFITYLIVYSFAGWVLESIYKSIYTKKFVNSGFLIGPYCPIYGFGAIIMLLTLNFLKEKPVLLFLASVFILSCWEYLVGLFLEKVFKTKYWDYSNIKFNIHGRICLKNSIYWGILGLIFIEILHPFVETQIDRLSEDVLVYTSTILGIAMIVDLVASVTTTISFDEMIAKINEIGETIKEKAKELTEREKIKTVAEGESNSENIEGIIAKLKVEQAKLKIRIYKQANRLKKAFPTMKSEKISQFLSEKIDLNKLKQNSKNKRKNERKMKG